jgi:hypothetical protein
MESASERLQLLIYDCCDWSDQFPGLQQERVIRYLMTLLR